MAVEERLERFLKKDPVIDPTAFIAPQSTLIGDISIGPYSSVWPGCVLRADINAIQIGEGTNVQDMAVFHLADDYGVKVGDYVTVGHKAMIHACTIEDECLIGMHATILDGAVIGTRSVVGAGALVTKGMIVPPGSVVMGMPGRIVKTLNEVEQGQLRRWAEKYVKVAAAHKAKLEGAQAYTY